MAQTQKNYVVCIDPGHGGKDAPGAVSASGLKESDFNLAIAPAMREYLKSIRSPYPTFTVLMTRSSDMSRSFESRCLIANNQGAQVFVSIHCDSVVDTSKRGAAVFYPEKRDKDKALSHSLADSMAKVLSSIFTKSRVDADDYRVLENTTMPAVLVECGFMSNLEDLAIIQNNQSKIGESLGRELNVWCQVNL